MAADEILRWLLTPLSGSADHLVAPALAWHGRLMVLSWGVLLPVGVLIARYFKVRRGQDWPRVLDNPWWWHRHRLSQYSGVALMTAGVSIAWWHGAGEGNAERLDAFATFHRYCGWTVFAVGWLQIAGAHARGSKGGPTDVGADPSDPSTWRGDHYDMTRRRIAFERVHKIGGWLSMALAAGTLLSGLGLADAPRWMFAALLTWWLVLALLALRWQRQGRRVDTWQAIWGRPDPG